jgi:hypothetical protein
MMVMSRNLKALVIFAFAVGLSSCGEEPQHVDSQGEIEKIKEVKITPLGLEDKIDWNRELELISGKNFLKRAAAELDIDLVALDDATRLELDPELKVIRVIARHQDGEIAKRYAASIAMALEFDRSESEINLVISKSMEDGSLESDRMTYEKAKEALEQESGKDGVLYRKGE